MNGKLAPEKLTEVVNKIAAQFAGEEMDYIYAALVHLLGRTISFSENPVATLMATLPALSTAAGIETEVIKFDEDEEDARLIATH